MSAPLLRTPPTSEVGAKGELSPAAGDPGAAQNAFVPHGSPRRPLVPMRPSHLPPRPARSGSPWTSLHNFKRPSKWRKTRFMVQDRPPIAPLGTNSCHSPARGIAGGYRVVDRRPTVIHGIQSTVNIVTPNSPW